MIIKEKLEQLLKEGDTIYEAKYGKIEHVDLSLAKEYLMSKEYIKLKDIKTHFLTRKRYNRLFETKEEAEWYLEFGIIQRTETLSLPSWKEAKKKMGSVMFYIKTGNILFGVSDDRTRIFIQSDETLFDKPLTKENYTEACRLAKKLFLGEKE